MPRYMVERTFPKGLHIPSNGDGSRACLSVVDRNATSGVTWVQSYVSTDKTKTYCVYDGPSEAAVHAAAEANNLPIDSITQVSVLDPYFYYEEVRTTVEAT